MLRRPATTLHITSEDVAAYEDRRAREALVAAQQARIAAAAEAHAASGAPGMDGVQASPDPEARVGIWTKAVGYIIVGHRAM
ncbi:hypothetical protein B0J13DRAFT_619117 [Dactylonectria estremocensis]|uniref:Anaphase-promoting complex subunit CDC26 n=1 Tax=Dactylonectria estremocensis TaxID=1079267 RepID=A0A9P9J7W7_9HYPO|nr:hypothetical protein B0J13DRAFT_619117 [Dactylonectria estremocensis]